MSRFDSSLRIWGLGDPDVPIETYTNPNKDTLVQFDWRVSDHDDYKSFQLLTMSKDQHVRLWNIEHSTQQACRGIPPPMLHRRNTEIENITDLSQEFAKIKKNGIPSVNVVEVSNETGK
jgi:hypothetical protein